MSSWRDQILKEFTPNVSRLTLVADPDGLLLEERILEGLRGRGFELIPFEDHIAFRYAYESKFRSHWDQGEQTDLVVILRTQASALSSLPYDLLQSGRRLSFNLGDIFPNLSYPVLMALDRGDLDALYEAQERHAPGQLGDNATKEFILRHVFEIVPELIKQASDLLRILLRRHYRNQQVPPMLNERLIQILRQNNTFRDWPVEKLLSDRETFFAFLQERWPSFLDRVAAEEESAVRENGKFYGIAIDGPVDLPLEHHDIRIYIDNLFVEGLLHPVPHARAHALSQTWVSIGVRTDVAEDRSHRLTKLIASLETSIPTDDARYGDWLHYAHGWAELIVLSNEQKDRVSETTSQSINNLQSQMDAGFTKWVKKRYAGLVNLPPSPPVMLHHLPRFLARQMAEDRTAKIALLVVDGLSLDQWHVMRDSLVTRQPEFHFREHATFAWIPTITSVSRQAIFSGKPPIFFPNSIFTTAKESVLWALFWVDQGLTPSEVVYAKGLGNGNLDSLSEMLSQPKLKIAGLVIDKVDRIMHGMELGTAGMHNQVRQWAQQPYMNNLLQLVLSRGFRIYLTSDHGNIEAEGCGRPSEGAVADLRGERVRIYPEAILRKNVKERFPSAIEWEPIGLPDTCLALVAPGRRAFVREGERTVSHGGFSVEELIVPLIEIEGNVS